MKKFEYSIIFTIFYFFNNQDHLMESQMKEIVQKNKCKMNIK